MFESYELPQPDEVAGLDDLDLVDAMTAATLLETVAIEVRFAAMQEMYERQLRQLRAPAQTRPAPPRPATALQRRSGRRRRGNRKRKRR
jgi:hypothetical protein